MTVFVVMGIGYFLTTSYGIEGIFGSAVAISAFFLVTPLEKGAMPLDRLGAKGNVCWNFSFNYCSRII